MIPDITQKKPEFGELFITNDAINGGMESLKHFCGKLITNVCGGYKKLFIIEEGHQDEGVVSTLHAPEYDDYDYTFSEANTSLKNHEDIMQAFDNKGQIKKMVCGRKHTVFVTENGNIFSYGRGEYGSLGHGGAAVCDVPRPILKLKEKKIIQIACGEYHTIALTDRKDLFAWGRGFEGQLGIKKQTSSIPTFVNFFYQGFVRETHQDVKCNINYITCGAYNSLALTEEGVLYAWGEARLGQCGTGKKKKLEPVPTIVQFNASEKDIEESTIKINPLRNPPLPGQKIVMISAGYGHTAAITEAGELYTWGFNVKGQLGVGDSKSRYYPTKLYRDILGNELPLFKNVACGYNNTFAIDVSGTCWSFGGGNIGQKNDHLQDLPRKITDNSDNRKFSEITATANCAAFFAPLRVMSVRPNYGPSCGGTLISLLGTGFSDTSKQSLKFNFGKYSQEVSLQYDTQTDSYYCQTPNFDSAGEEIVTWPQKCTLEATLDGKIYCACEQQYLIYSSKIQTSSIDPKCASVKGGNKLILNINIDDQTSGYLKHLTVGFQRRIKKTNETNSKNVDTPEQGMKRQQSQENQRNEKVINPLDLSTSDPELDKENWICVQGVYSKGKITCTVPRLNEFQQNCLHFNVDVSLNGQQFTGQPSSFRFYDIQISEMFPNNVTNEGGAVVKIQGEGFFDTLHKKIKLESKFGDRMIDMQWDKQNRLFTFVAPPINWLLGGQDESEELISEIQAAGVKVYLTLNFEEWIFVQRFNYIQPAVERIAPAHIDAHLNEEEAAKAWLAEDWSDPLVGLEGEELNKKKEELHKIDDADDVEMQTLFKKAGVQLYIQGKNYVNTGDILIRFIFDNKVETLKAIFKNNSKLAVVAPELEFVPQGIHPVGIEISFNGQNFSTSGKTFQYLSFTGLEQAQRHKFEEDQIKELKKAHGKKK